MQVGVNNFSGDQLREAIEFRTVSQKKLATEIDVNPSNVTKYLKGTLKPSPAVFEKISLVLQFPKEFFLEEAPVGELSEEEQNPALWRSLKAATKRARSRGKVILKWQKKLYFYFSEFFDYPQFVSPGFVVPYSFEDIDSSFIDEYCLALRREWGLGNDPIANLTRILERKGICVSGMDLGNKTLDAVSLWDAGVPFVLLNSSVTSSARLRFNIAHELGHILLHQNISCEDLEDESRFSEIEEQAHYFASSLLLPEMPLTHDFWAPTLKCIESLKAKWNVSIQAIMRRCLELNLITTAQFSYLNIAISRKGWRTKEPLDDTTPVEVPRLFCQSLERLTSDYDIMPVAVASQMSLPSSITAEICATNIERFIPPKSMSDDSIIQFHPKA